MTPIELNRLLGNMTSDANPRALLRSIDFKTLLPSTRHLLLDFAFSHDTQLQQPMVVLKVMDELNNLSLSQQWHNPLSALIVSWFGEERCLAATNLMNVFKSECPNEFRHYQETKPALEALDIDPDIRCCYLIQQYQQPVHVLPQVDFNMVAD